MKHRFVHELKDLQVSPVVLPASREDSGNEKPNLNELARLILSDLSINPKLGLNQKTKPHDQSIRIGSFSGALQELGLDTVYRIIRGANGTYIFKESGVEESR